MRKLPLTPSRAAARGGSIADERIHVLWLVKGLGPGGMEHLLTLSARRRDRKGLDVRAAFLLPHKVALVPELEAEGVRVACLGRSHLVDPRWLWSLLRSLRADPVHIVHAHSPLAAVAARLITRLQPRAHRPSLITTEHSLWSGHRRLMRWANALTWRLDDAHIAVSHAIWESIPPRLRRGAEVVTHGVDVDHVRREGGFRDAIRAELGIAADTLVVGTVANLRPVKAYPDLISAAQRVVAARPDVRFVAVGQGPQEAEIRGIHAASGLGDRMLLLGHRRDAVRVMGACDVFCLPSLHEGLPVALMEALALGLPVVASAVGGILEVVDHGSEGLLVAPGRPDLLAQALLDVLSDDGRRAAMAGAAAARGADLSIAGAVQRTEEIYRSVAEPRRVTSDPH